MFSSKIYFKIHYFTMQETDGWCEIIGATSKYSGDLKSDHLKSRNFQNPDFVKVGFQMVSM